MSPSPNEDKSVVGTNSQTSVEPRRVAVIGVHGVAHHDPGETANAMADLLLSLPPFNPKQAGTPCEQQEAPVFQAFDAKGLQIPLRPVCLDTRVDVERNQSVPAAFRLQEGSYKFSLHLWKEKQVGTRRGEVGRNWSIKLLQDYYGAADSSKYVTTRLGGRRRSDDTEVHIYEMYWADLARPTSSVLSFLLALFQLILHLPSLSRVAIDTRPNPDRVWRVFQAFHRYAARVLQIALPLTKVVLLIVLAAAIPAVTHVKHLDVISAVVVGITVGIGIFIATNYAVKPVFQSRSKWFLASFLLPILATLVTYVAVRNSSGDENKPEIILLVAAIWIVGGGLLSWAMAAYQQTRPGITGYGWSAFLISLAGFSIAAWAAAHSHSQTSVWIQQASFWTAQWLLAALRLSWICLALLAITSSFLGAIAWRRSPKAERSKTRAVVRTSRFALAMPAFLFVFITSIIWAALFSLGHTIHDPFYDAAVIETPAWHPHADWMNSFDLFPNKNIARGFPDDCTSGKPACSGPGQTSCTCSPDTQPNYLRGVLAWSLGSSSYLVVLVSFAGLFILIWWALPSVLTERFPPRRDYGWYQRHGTEPPRAGKNKDALWMGAWISRGLDSISVVTWLSWSAIFLIPLAFIYLGWPWHSHYLELLRVYSDDTTKRVVCKAIAVVSTTAILASLVHYSSPILRVILDVDTYLRTGPIEGTPRAKIFERYVSLLRHVALYQGPDGRGYDHVVIVAHSLGALISGDLLNLLQHQVNASGETIDPNLRKYGFGHTRGSGQIPIRLFTMGNPLRQLLNRFFPYLYDWVRETPDNGVEPLPPPTAMPPTTFTPATPSDPVLPDPDDLGVEKWVSAYRSGDYVGRSLWLTEWYKRTATCSENGIYPEPIYKVEAENRVEFCIGAGAHTHYWDDTAPDIAEALNDLI